MVAGVKVHRILMLGEEGGVFRYLVGPSDVDLNDQIPIRVGHVLESHISKNAGIVDEDMDMTVFLNSSLDDAFAVVHAVIIRDCLAPRCLNLSNDRVSRLGRLAVSLESASKVVHDDIGTFAAKIKTIGPP